MDGPPSVRRVNAAQELLVALAGLAVQQWPLVGM